MADGAIIHGGIGSLGSPYLILWSRPKKELPVSVMSDLQLGKQSHTHYCSWAFTISQDSGRKARSRGPLNAAGSWIEPHVTARSSHIKKSMPNKSIFVTIIVSCWKLSCCRISFYVQLCSYSQHVGLGTMSITNIGFGNSWLFTRDTLVSQRIHRSQPMEVWSYRINDYDMCQPTANSSQKITSAMVDNFPLNWFNISRLISSLRTIIPMSWEPSTHDQHTAITVFQLHGNKLTIYQYLPCLTQHEI